MTERLIALVGVFAVCSLIGGFLWPYTIETWCLFFSKSVNIAFWQGALLGFCPVIGQATIPLSVITYILMLILV